MKKSSWGLIQDKRFHAAALFVVLAAMILGGALFLMRRRADGNILPAADLSQTETKSAPELVDLTDSDATPEQVEAILSRDPAAVVRWNVPLSAGRFDSESEELQLTGFTAGDLELMKYFPRLKRLEVTGSADYAALSALREALPGGEIAWSVELGGVSYPNDTGELSVTDKGITLEELTNAMAGLPVLERVTLSDGVLSQAEREALARSREDVAFCWPVTVCGRTFSSEDRVISFAGDKGMTEAELDEIWERAVLFNDLQAVDLTDCGLDDERLHRLDLELGDTDVIWTFDIYGVTVTSTDEEIDLSGHTTWDKGREVDQKVEWMPHLRRVTMAECYVSDKDMDALNQKHENIRFVWMVQVKWAGIMTDAKWFIPYPESGAKQFPVMVGVQALKYCPDLIALDLGHTNLSNLDFLSVMPHLQYLILAENWLRDAEPIAQLKELRWLEMFLTGFTDISPIAQCTELENLNICYVMADGDNIYNTVRQLKKLRRLWCCGTLMSEEQLAALHEELPDCEIYSEMGGESTGSTWRYDDDYYEMRDAFHMYYMSWDGNTVERLSEEELQAVHKKYWGY